MSEIMWHFASKFHTIVQSLRDIALFFSNALLESLDPSHSIRGGDGRLRRLWGLYAFISRCMWLPSEEYSHISKRNLEEAITAFYKTWHTKFGMFPSSLPAFLMNA